METLKKVFRFLCAFFNNSAKENSVKTPTPKRSGKITRGIFRNYTECPTLGWLSYRKKFPGLSPLNHDFFVYEITKIRKEAQKLFPGIIDVSKLNSKELLEILSDDKTISVSGAKILRGNFCARIDILERAKNGAWNLYEIKTGKTCKARYAEDISFNAMILEKSGVKLADKIVVYISDSYRLGMPPQKLFKFRNCNERVLQFLFKYSQISDDISQEIIFGKNPDATLQKNCKNCPAFDECIGQKIKDSIFDMPRLSTNDMDELIDKRIWTIKDIPENFDLTHRQKIIKNCHKTNSIYVSTKLKGILDKLTPPYFYLDFESMNTILPIYDGFAPHTQIVTQFSIHKCDAVDKLSEHFEYIADPKLNSQEVVAEKLIDYLGQKGSIIVYAVFEKRAIETLALLYPKYSRKLLDIANRIVDFEDIVTNNYYDIRFKGRGSIKVILPLMANINYDNLEIGEGGDAAAAFAFMAMGVYDEQKSKETKEFLLKYCAQDTLALMKIHKFLYEVSHKGNS